MILLEKLKILTPLQKLPMNVGNLGKLIVAKSIKKLLNLVTKVWFPTLGINLLQRRLERGIKNYSLSSHRWQTFLMVKRHSE